MRPIRFAALALLSAFAVAPAAAQEPYPTRPIHIVVPFPAGGPSDVLTRMIGERMSADFGQAIVVDNRPGANTVIGAQLAAKAAPDGYTLLMAIEFDAGDEPISLRKLPYDPLNDFAPVSLAAKNVGLLVVNAESDLKTREGSDRESQSRARQTQLRRRHDHHQAHLHSVQREGRHRDRADFL